MAGGRWHVAKQGESVESIAHRYGHLWQTVWEDDNNAKLRELRRSPHCLAPGDQVFVARLRKKTVKVETGKRHVFRVHNTPSRLRVYIDIDGEPRANEPYRLTIDDSVVLQGTTNADGLVDQPVWPRASSAVLHFDADPPQL
jgi:hypothetical protein